MTDHRRPRPVHVGHCRIEPATCRVFRDGKEHRLEPKIMDVLECLIEARGALVSKGELLDRVWADVHVTDAVVFRSIAELRRTLGTGADGPAIETLRGRGYRLCWPIRAVEAGSNNDSEWVSSSETGVAPRAERATERPRSKPRSPRSFPRNLSAHAGVRSRRLAIPAAGVVVVMMLFAASAVVGRAPDWASPAVRERELELDGFNEQMKRGHDAYRRVDRAGVEAAIRHFGRAAELRPAAGLAHAGLAAALTQKHGMFQRDDALLDEAEKEARRALELLPEEAEAHRALGLVLSARGRLDEAAAAFGAAIDRAAEATAARGNLANVLLLSGRLDESLAAWRRIEGAEPPRWVQLVNRSAPLILLQELGAGRAALEEALELAPFQPRAVVNLAMIDLYEGRVEAARAGVGRALVVRPESAILWTARGELDQVAGNHIAAIEAFRRALALSPIDNVDATLGLAGAYLARDRIESGRALLVRVERIAEQRLREGDESFSPRVWLARSAALRGDSRASFAWLQRAAAAGLTNVRWIETAPELAATRGEPAFAAWLGTLQARLRGMRERAVLSG